MPSHEKVRFSLTRCLSTIWILYNSRNTEEFCGSKKAKPQPIFFCGFKNRLKKMCQIFAVSEPHFKTACQSNCGFGTANQNRMPKHLRFRNRKSKPHAKSIAVFDAVFAVLKPQKTACALIYFFNMIKLYFY